MIKIFAVDLDGCISQPFQTPDWDAISKIRELNKLSKHNPVIPALTISTGRPLPYAEAVAQWLGVYHPIVFESGGGFYHPVTNELTWSPQLTDDVFEHIRNIRKWVTEKIVPEYPGTILEFTKHTDVGVVSPDYSEIKEIYRRVRKYVEERYNIFDIHYTEVSVNVILKSSNKGTGIKQIAEMVNISTEEMAYMGDGTNDIPALEKVKLPFAPLNAREEVKKVAKVMEVEATKAVEEAYNTIIEYNRQLALSEERY